MRVRLHAAFGVDESRDDAIAENFYICPDKLFRRIRKMGRTKRPEMKLGHFSVTRFCNMNERIARKKDIPRWPPTTGCRMKIHRGH